MERDSGCYTSVPQGAVDTPGHALQAAGREPETGVGCRGRERGPCCLRPTAGNPQAQLSPRVQLSSPSRRLCHRHGINRCRGTRFSASIQLREPTAPCLVLTHTGTGAQGAQSLPLCRWPGRPASHTPPPGPTEAVWQAAASQPPPPAHLAEQRQWRLLPPAQNLP